MRERKKKKKAEQKRVKDMTRGLFWTICQVGYRTVLDYLPSLLQDCSGLFAKSVTGLFWTICQVGYRTVLDYLPSLLQGK
ncbi:hypothetical protein BaRGS_00004091 [Batillaria attramentaria]|uniref:Uncharacterized protein n=1 Tax=Batillaria attramentaria TaxID=370345 RepID=A0ABD0LY76_9CAEN